MAQVVVELGIGRELETERGMIEKENQLQHSRYKQLQRHPCRQTTSDHGCHVSSRANLNFLRSLAKAATVSLN